MPTNNSVSLAPLNLVQHFSELSSARFFGRFRLGERGNNFQPLFGGKFPQFDQLRFDTQNLSIVLLCTFTSVEKITHFGSFLGYKIFFDPFAAANTHWPVRRDVGIPLQNRGSARCGGHECLEIFQMVQDT
ncbi:hypothetical protein HY524_01870 [Candidatus Berkelbacteria bacterium]|nr:hypothetical protein [Candidatus Berkelbacteria bacterium]